MKWPQKKEMYSREERWRHLKKALFNLFYLPSEAVYLDLLTDSGTGQMSKAQWQAMQDGDESYAGSQSARKLKRAVRELFGVPYVLLVHQGRAAENVFGNVMQKERGMLVLGNTPFDTTRMHIERRGGIIVDCTAKSPLPHLSSLEYPETAWQQFWGNIDVAKLEFELNKARAGKRYVAYVLITATCNSNAGQPVSLANIQKTCRVAHGMCIPVFLDLARYAENAYFIKNYERGCSHLTIPQIIKAMTENTDGFLASGKKDALGNMGGFLGLRSPELVKEVLSEIIFMEGLDLEHTETGSGQDQDLGGYGGMSGRDMEALNRGIKESADENYLALRVAQVRNLAVRISEVGVPVLPPGGHAVFVDAGAFLPHLSWEQFPGHALALALYLEGGIRAVEIGSLMLGHDPTTKQNRKAPQELTRLAIPRRVYSDEELIHIVKAFSELKKCAERIGPVKIIEELQPRHFRSQFSWEGIG